MIETDTDRSASRAGIGMLCPLGHREEQGHASLPTRAHKGGCGIAQTDFRDRGGIMSHDLRQVWEREGEDACHITYANA